MTEYCIIFTTANDAAQAKKITDALLPAHAAADVQTTEISSAYWWKGEVRKKPEILLQIKTRAELFPAVEKIIRENHTYEVPQIIAIPIIAGGKDYLDWIKEETK
ncbi:MAG: divalent-cation tolerance protein CutA [Proteobacteria bacterium]|nr:divalent-cation tolerance protein CutA [Pseudomonadota bacterium]